MADVYVPWPRPRAKEFRGPSRAAAAAAVSAYRATAPWVRQYPALIFFVLLVAGCLAAWGLQLLCQEYVRVEQRLLVTARIQPGQWLTLEQLAAGASEVRAVVPGALLYPLQLLVVRDVLGLVGIITFVSILAMFAIWLERKVAGWIQSRIGPMRVGGWHGWSQSLADGIKLIAKEDLIPAGADRMLYRLAPYINFVPALMGFVALPFGVYWVFRNLDVGLLFILAMLGLEVIGVLLAGWASNNKWSVFGALREAAQVVAYEIPMGMSLLIPVMVAGTLQLAGDDSLMARQAGGWFNWLAWHSPWTFVAMFTYFIASLAACKRAPFDLPEAESELVAGFHTEYSGFRWSLFFFAEYAAMFIVSGILVLLFLGGWDAPWVGLAPAAWGEPHAPLGAQLLCGVVFSGPFWFILKAMLLVYLQMWLRWTLPRLRIDQVLFSCVQVILPLTMIVLLASVFWELALGYSAAFTVFSQVISFVLALVGAAIAVAIVLVALAGLRQRRALVGTMGVERPLPGG